MATGSRTLKLAILADVDQLNKSLKAANNDVEDSSSKIGDFGKKAGLAFAAAAAAAGAYAVKIGIDGVKAALDDEKAQRILAQTLQNTTGATQNQIAAVESYITKTALAVGVTDDQLRPAFSRLVRSTKDTEEAQKLLNLALDISSATGKPLEAIANSLGKAYDGNTNALGKLGLGIDQNILKTKDFNLVYDNLRTSFAGFAQNEANTFQGRIERMKVALDEAKETIGFALLPILEKLMNFMTTNVIPIVEKLSNAFSNKSGGLAAYIEYLGGVITNVFTPIWNGLVKAFGYIKDAIGDNMDSFKAFGQLIVDYVAPVLGKVLGQAFENVGKIAGVVINIIGDVLGAMTKLVTGAISAINWLIDKYNSIPFLPNIPTIPVSSAPKISMPSSSTSTPSANIPTVPTISPPTVAGSAAATQSAAASGAKIAAAAPSPIANLVPTVTIGGAPAGYVKETFTPTVTIGGAPAGYVSNAAPAPQVTVNMGVVGDPEAAARTITNVLNNSYFRGTGGAGALIL